MVVITLIIAAIAVILAIAALFETNRVWSHLEEHGLGIQFPGTTVGKQEERIQKLEGVVGISAAPAFRVKMDNADKLDKRRNERR